MNRYRYLIKTGIHAGEIHDGVGCNARSHPDAEPDTINYGDGIYLTELGLRLPQERDPNAKHCGDTIHYRDLIIPFDKYGNEIFVGDTLYASVSNEVRIVTVIKFGKFHHVGCGWMQQKLVCRDADSGKTLTINIPSYSIKMVSRDEDN